MGHSLKKASKKRPTKTGKKATPKAKKPLKTKPKDTPKERLKQAQQSLLEDPPEQTQQQPDIVASQDDVMTDRDGESEMDHTEEPELDGLEHEDDEHHEDVEP